MAQINDAKKETLANLGYVYTAIDDAYKAYLQTESGLTEGTIQDLEKYLFEFLGYSGTLQNMWFEFLRDNGYTNSLQDMLHAFWNSDSAGLSPLYFSDFYAPLTHTAVPERAAAGTTATFTRATTETGQKWDEAGYLDFTALAGEIVFKGARRERNLIPAARTSEDLTLWDKSGITVSANQYVAPNGATTMDKILASAGNSQHILLNGATAPIAYSAGPHLLQCYLRYDNHRYVYIALNDGTNVPVVTVDLLNGVIANTTASTTAYIEEVEAGVYLVGLFRTMVAFANGSAYIGLNNTGAASAETWNAAGTEAIGCWGVALYNITGETDQTTIRPYVSVGAVQRNLLKQSNKFDDTTVWGTEGASPLSFTQNLPAPTGINCDAGWTVTDNSDVNFEASSQILALTLAGYTATHYVAKTTGAQSSYPILYYYTSTGNVIAIATVDTSNGIATAWTAYTGFTIASGFTATCTSHDSIYWKVVLNFTATAASWKSAFGAAGTATANKSSGTLSEGSLTGSAGFAGAMLTLATADQTYQAVGGTYPYHGSGVDGVKCFPTDLSGNPIPSTTMLGYQAEGARTNVLLHSNDLSNAAWSKPGPLAIAQNEIGVDGAISAWTLTDDNVGVDENVNQASVKTAATWTDSCYFKKTIGAQATYPVFYAFDGATRVALCTVDTTNGVATVWTAYTGLTVQPSVARCRSFNDDKWFVELSFTATAATWTTTVDAAGTTNATQSTGTLNVALTGSCVVERLQSELGTAASSYIATTTVAVTRNADVLTYSGGDIPNLKTLCATFRRESGVASTGVVLELDDGGGLAYNAMYLTSATNLRFEGRTTGGGGAIQWQVNASNAYTPGASSKSAVSAATNDIKMAFSGVAQTADTSATLSPFTQLSVGHSGGTGGLQLSGNVGGIYGWTRNLSQSEVNAVTA